MAEISGDHTAEQVHCGAFKRENADLDIRRPAHDLNATPLHKLAAHQSCGHPADYPAKKMRLCRSSVTFTTRRTSFDVWAALGCLEDLLSDYRRIEPRYCLMQTAGEAGIAVGNEYRLTLSDPVLLEQINTAIGDMISGQSSVPGIKHRAMDVRVIRTGPWGGETGELVVKALRNHALAGASSLWVLAHDHADDGNLRVTLDALELTRWAWAPDLLASRRRAGDTLGARIIDWDYLFERLVQKLDGLPEKTAPGASYSIIVEPNAIAQDDQIIDALKIHGGLMPYVDQVKSR